MTARGLLVLACVSVLGCAVPRDAPRSAIEVEPVFIQTQAGPARGWLARVDLTGPGVEIVVTAPPDRADRMPKSAEALLEPTPDWAARQGLTLAINANYFGTLTRGAGSDAGPRWADIIGLCVSDGGVVSPRRVFAGQAGPVLWWGADGRASITTAYPIAGVADAIAGVGPSAGVPSLGGLLVTDGRNTGATCRVDPLARHPRTAVGVDRAGRTLWLVVIDGRQPGWSVGVTLPELAGVLIDAGVDRAVNLDGGGSSSFYFNKHPARPGPSSDTISNRPSDGPHRPVAAHLGIRLGADR